MVFCAYIFKICTAFECLFRILALAVTVTVFHTEHTVIAFAMDMLEYILIVDFPAGGFFAPGVVTQMEGGNLIPGLIDIWNQVTLGDLLVLEVIDDLAIGAVHSSTNQIGLGDLLQKEARMIGPPVQGFQH